MNPVHLVKDLEQALAQLPMFDVHTHLVGGKLAARGLHDILLYHMVVSDLYAAGCPSGARLTQYPSWPAEEEARARIKEALDCLPILLQRCDQKHRASLRDARVRIEMLDEIQLDEGLAVLRYGSSKIVR